ncbi:MAG: hypothetical protein CM15mP115_18430 [Alphaproteobacteria bacterium]|nr:MAG: hypothetical protein CM15mP115_18430 [Alphaproteobacteria bacterium]
MIIGGAAGAAIGGPIGGLLGAAAGIAVERGFVTPVLAANTEKDASRGVAFTVAVIALSAKMAKADGMVTRTRSAPSASACISRHPRCLRSDGSGIWRARQRKATRAMRRRWRGCSARARRS